MLGKLIYVNQNLSSFLVNHRTSIIILLLFFLNLLLVSPELMPDYSEVNPDDEAKYVDSGWRLLHGNIRDMAWGPVVALVYAPVHLIVGSTPDWFLLELWAGRFFLFIAPNKRAYFTTCDRCSPPYLDTYHYFACKPERRANGRFLIFGSGKFGEVLQLG
jgi:hypothetical protein